MQRTFAYPDEHGNWLHASIELHDREWQVACGPVPEFATQKERQRKRQEANQARKRICVRFRQKAEQIYGKPMPWIDWKNLQAVERDPRSASM